MRGREYQFFSIGARLDTAKIREENQLGRTRERERKRLPKISYGVKGKTVERKKAEQGNARPVLQRNTSDA